MTRMMHAPRPSISFMPWLIAALASLVAPLLAMQALLGSPSRTPWVLVAGPMLALGLMGAGMITSAAAGRFRIGVLMALLAAICLVLAEHMQGMPSLPHPVAMSLAFVAASVSFAARGKLFARSAGDKGWWIAIVVVAGEAAMLGTAAAMPGALPDWLLVLLPAQWASMAIQTALTGAGTIAAGSALVALTGTAAMTLLVARLLPRRWPYALMFSAWLGLSALVWHYPPPAPSHADLGGIDTASADIGTPAASAFSAPGADRPHAAVAAPTRPAAKAALHRQRSAQ